MRTIALRADPPAGSLLAPAPLPPPGACQLGRLPIPMSDIRGNEGKEHERGREGGEIRTDVPLATLVESLLVLVGACVRTGTAAGMGVEDMSSTALRLFLTGARLAAD
jgi:hypothetical protein